jgi:hypothetical protein
LQKSPQIRSSVLPGYAGFDNEQSTTSPFHGKSPLNSEAEDHAREIDMPTNSIAMRDKDHHIHLVPSGRVLMMSIEHSAIKKVDGEHFEVECFIKLSVEGLIHPLEDVIRFTFAALRMPGQQMMTELTLVQNHIIKNIFDQGISGNLITYPPEDPRAKESGITIASEIKTVMIASKQLKEVLARNGAMADTMVIIQ